MKITIGRGLLESVMELARELHPQEVVLLLRGKVSRGEILIEDFLLPPFASAGLGFAQFPSHMLPIDFSIVGTAHSHPSGSVSPSVTDLNHFYGRVMLILAYPYRDTSVAVYNSKGKRLPFSLEG